MLKALLDRLAAKCVVDGLKLPEVPAKREVMVKPAMEARKILRRPNF